ncbi:MAG: PD-(D/E)XK nuclease family protein [Firmicutes bacterium]|nr:PD-(D/E)XK nuclease family protein [Bacillota bacterium]
MHGIDAGQHAMLPLQQTAPDKFMQDQINSLLTWEYPNNELTKMKGKTSVSEISENDNNQINISKKPKFLEDRIKLTRAEIGTITHLILQKLDFRIEYDGGKLKDLIDGLVKSEIISNKEAQAVDIEDILRFTESDLYHRVQKSKKIFKEQPFYINIPAEEIYECNLKENILVQGIIDLYFVDANDKIVLVDYKTDYVKDGSEQELIEKYKNQLNIYKKAIEESTETSVNETYIYSVYLHKTLQIY